VKLHDIVDLSINGTGRSITSRHGIPGCPPLHQVTTADSNSLHYLRRVLARRCILLALVVLVAAATSTACGGSNSSAPNTVTKVEVGKAALKQAPPVDPGLALQNAFVHVVADTAPTVVQIETSVGLGSGVVYDDQGDIVTNAHVVGTAKTFTITLANGDRHSGTLVGTFVPNDLAVVHVEGATPAPAQFGDSSALAIGDIVFAIGNPLGLRSSVTEGIVSSLGRTVGEGNGVALASVIQTSAAINPGNSGGALVDLDSQVIGIPTLAALDPDFGSTPAAGIGFAIPSDTVKLIADQLIKTGKVTQSGRAYLGVRVATQMTGGVLVTSVQPGGPAAAAGIKPGDLIISVNKTVATNTDDLATVLAGIKPGTTVPIVVVRNGKKLTIDVKVGELKSG
jgi:putative serine protease PepD